MNLSKEQQKHLISLAHKRKAIVRVGQHGLSENILKELEIALDVHELVKVKIAVGDRDVRDDAIGKLIDASGAQNIQKIGNTLTLFRRNKKKPVIVLT